jgi:hypothetical protein
MREVKQIAMGELKSQIPGMQKKEDIEFTDYNYPICVKLIHFKMSELSGSVKTVVRMIYLSYLLIVIISLINCNTPIPHNTTTPQHSTDTHK